MPDRISNLLLNISKEKPWHTKPVFCFTTDIDWASETTLKLFFDEIFTYQIVPTVFVTHASRIIDELFADKKIERGIHPNFLKGSSHGGSFEDVINTCLKFAPETKLYRSHRGYNSTDTNHLLRNKYHFKVSSNTVTVMQQHLQPVLHESGLLEFPVFFEDGTHLYNKLELDIDTYLKNFTSPGIKIISFHPMNFVVNPPTLSYMRNIKDTLSREEYNNLSLKKIEQYKNQLKGIKDICIEILKLSGRYDVLTLDELYNISIN
ncbi:MAG TPA: hypothetical protein VIJ92_07475 [Ginsengibacter sp.]